MSLIPRSVHRIQWPTRGGLTNPSVVLECFVAAERLIAILAVESLVVHRRILLVLFECFFGAEKAIASLAVDFLIMHTRFPFVLFECFLAGKITTAENTVVHSIDNCSLLFVRIVGGNTSCNGTDVSSRTAESLNRLPLYVVQLKAFLESNDTTTHGA